jgi:inhibitor of the pro-sigma K processing machinery
MYKKGVFFMGSITFGTVVGYLLGVLIVFVAAKIFFVPLKKVLRIVLNSALGALVLVIINLFGPFLHIYIGVNPVSALVLGLLGVPGLCLLMILQIFF